MTLETAAPARVEQDENSAMSSEFGTVATLIGNIPANKRELYCSAASVDELGKSVKYICQSLFRIGV